MRPVRFDRALTQPLAAELIASRQRGVDRLDGPRPPRIAAPILTALSRLDAEATGIIRASRQAEIELLLRRATAACRLQGYRPVARFMYLAFFIPVTSGDPPVKRREGQQTVRRQKVKDAFGWTEDSYDEEQLSKLIDFATFLLAFVEAEVARATAAHMEQPEVAEPAAPMVEQPAAPAMAAVPAGSTPAPLRCNQTGRAIVVATLLGLALLGTLLVSLTHLPAWPTGQEVLGQSAAEGAARQTYTEIAGEFGAPTFTDPHQPAVTGRRVQPYQQVQVVCKVLAPTIPSATPDGFWYRISSAPWNGHYYAVANTFLNGDPIGGPTHHNTDHAVPNCPS